MPSKNLKIGKYNVLSINGDKYIIFNIGKIYVELLPIDLALKSDEFVLLPKLELKKAELEKMNYIKEDSYDLCCLMGNKNPLIKALMEDFIKK